jgi:hypothetical protein
MLVPICTILLLFCGAFSLVLSSAIVKLSSSSSNKLIAAEILLIIAPSLALSSAVLIGYVAAEPDSVWRFHIIATARILLVFGTGCILANAILTDAIAPVPSSSEFAVLFLFTFGAGCLLLGAHLLFVVDLNNHVLDKSIFEFSSL